MRDKNLYSKRRSQKGSVLFVILIAVALFAALSYTVANMMSSGNTATITEEQAKVYAGEIVDYARKIRQAVQELRISNGCSDTEVSFQNDFTLIDYTNPNAPGDFSCHVFHPDGAAIGYVAPNTDWLNDAFNVAPYNTGIFGYHRFSAGHQIEEVGSSATELRLSLNFINENVCIAINEILGVENPSGSLPIEVSDTATSGGNFIGIYGTPVADNIGDDGGHNLSGKMAFCRAGGSSNNQFSQVLIVR